MEELDIQQHLQRIDTTQSVEKDIGAIAQHLFSTLGIKQKSFINTRLVKHLARGCIYAEKYNSKLMKLLVDTVLEFYISVQGKGHIALLEAFKAVLRAHASEIDSEKTENKVRRKLLG